MRDKFQWRIRTRELSLGTRTLVMGIINVTPDSFSDGGRFFSAEKATEHALRLLEEGADILDIGGESTRPGKREPTSVQMEIDRVLPVIENILKESSTSVISVDTYKALTAKAAVAAGAEIVNDVSGLRWDPEMAATLAELECGAVLMHTRGRPGEWGELPPLPSPLELVEQELKEVVRNATDAGIQRESIVLDPGFGFGKKMEENYALLARLNELRKLGFPVLAGTSRKSFVAKNPADSDSILHGTLATVTASILQGAHVVRVHDVRPALEAARVADAIVNASGET